MGNHLGSENGGTDKLPDVVGPILEVLENHRGQLQMSRKPMVYSSGRCNGRVFWFEQ